MSRRTCAAPSSMAAWVSWPQACITPGVCDAKGRPVSSRIGRASMSARRPTHLGLLVVAAAVVAAVGAVPSITAVTPYPPTFSLGSRPMSRSRARHVRFSFCKLLSPILLCTKLILVFATDKCPVIYENPFQIFLIFNIESLQPKNILTTLIRHCPSQRLQLLMLCQAAW